MKESPNFPTTVHQPSGNADCCPVRALPVLDFATKERYMNVLFKSRLVRLTVCAAIVVWMAAYGFAAVAMPQVSHGPTLPPDPWDGKVAHGPTLPPDPWDGKVAHGPTRSEEHTSELQSLRHIV